MSGRTAAIRIRTSPKVQTIVAAMLVIVMAALLVVPRFPAGTPRAAAYVAVALAVLLVVRALGGGRGR